MGRTIPKKNEREEEEVETDKPHSGKIHLG
jgi:hypothetical protein